MPSNVHETCSPPRVDVEQGLPRPTEVATLLANVRAARWRESSTRPVAGPLAGWIRTPLPDLVEMLLNVARQAEAAGTIPAVAARTWEIRYGLTQPPVSRAVLADIMNVTPEAVDNRVRQVNAALCRLIKPREGAPANIAPVLIDPKCPPLHGAIIDACAELAGALGTHQELLAAVTAIASSVGVLLPRGFRNGPQYYRQRRHQVKTRAEHLIAFHQLRRDLAAKRGMTLSDQALHRLTSTRRPIPDRGVKPHAIIQSCRALLDERDLLEWDRILSSRKAIDLDIVESLVTRTDRLIQLIGREVAPLTDLVFLALAPDLHGRRSARQERAQGLISTAATHRTFRQRELLDLDVLNTFRWLRSLEYANRLRILQAQRDAASVLNSLGFASQSHALYVSAYRALPGLKLEPVALLLERTAQLVGDCGARFSLFGAWHGRAYAEQLDSDLDAALGKVDRQLGEVEKSWIDPLRLQLMQIRRRRLDAALEKHRLGAQNEQDLKSRLCPDICWQDDQPLVALQACRSHMRAALALGDVDTFWLYGDRAARVHQMRPWWFDTAREVVLLEERVERVLGCRPETPARLSIKALLPPS